MAKYLHVHGPALHPDGQGPMTVGDIRDLDPAWADRWVADGALTLLDEAAPVTSPAAKRRASATTD